MYTLIAFATEWGSKHGGINSFNADFLTAFGVAYHLKATIICIVPSATQEQVEVASKSHIQLVPLPYPPEGANLTIAHGEAAVNRLKQTDITLNPDETIWLGHDRITGEAAIAAANVGGGRSAVIHHMSYAYYETYAATSQLAQEKILNQTKLLEAADIVLAIGPLLRDAAKDLVGESKSVHMLVPGLAEIDPKDAPSTFSAFLSARLSEDASRIKQGRLGVAAFSTAQREARDDGRPDAFRKQPRLVLRGVSVDGQISAGADPETELKLFAEKYAQGVVNLHVLPYTEDRQQLYSELSRASVALMPSWHEGFGLTAWEAIAAGVPLIISKNSGVYRLLDEEYLGAGTGCVYAIEVAGATVEPYFTDRDLKQTAASLKTIADDPNKARKQASILRNMLGDRSWAACSKEAVDAFGWELAPGLIAEITAENISVNPIEASSVQPVEEDQGPLIIPVRRWRAGSGMADSQLLRAEEGLLEFDSAREPDVEKLNEWIDDTSYPLSVRLITAAGGQGKTRLALEVCCRRRTAGWCAGFLDSTLEPREITLLWRRLRERKEPTLIVIDYAETRQLVLLALLKEALQNPHIPTRVLLLARDGGEWWGNLAKDRECEALLNGYATTGPLPLRPLYEAEDDRGIAYRKALNAFAETLGVIAPESEPDLSGDHFERPLFIQIAALLALYGEQPITAQGLTRALLNHEGRYWEALLSHFNWPEPARRAEQLLALTTLAGGFATPNAAQPYWRTAKADVITASDFNAVFRELVTLYPGGQGLQALRPDLLGEALVSQALLRPQGETLLDAVLTSSASRPIRRNALTVLARVTNQRSDLHQILVEAFTRHFTHCCSDIVSVSKETRSQLPKIAELAFSGLSSPAKSQAAGIIGPDLVNESVELASLSCRINGYLVEKFYEKFKIRPHDFDRTIQYANALVNFSITLGRIGSYEEAHDAGKTGLELFEQLVLKGQKNLENSYAWALNRYGNCLSDLGKYEEALVPILKAVQINKRLAEKNPKRFGRDYCGYLSNYAVHLTGVGKYEEALNSDQLALDTYNQLFQRPDDKLDPDYALLVHNYAAHLAVMGKYEEALASAYEALAIRRQLCMDSPDRFDPDLESSLMNYVGRLVDLGRYEEALEYGEEALAITKRLMDKNPDRFEIDYADCLFRCTHIRSDLGRTEEAINDSIVALEISKRLAQRNPRFEHGYASSLLNYAYYLNDLGQDTDALRYSAESLVIRKRLLQQYPVRFEPDYAWALNNHAGYLSSVGQYEKALECSYEGLQIFKRLANKSPERSEEDLSISLTNYSNRLAEVGNIQDALTHAREAFEVRTRLARTRPNRFLLDVFLASCNATWLEWLGNQKHSEYEMPDPQRVISSILPHRQPFLLFSSAFVRACTGDLSARKDCLREANLNWLKMTRSDQNRSKSYRFCLEGWRTKFDPGFAETSWTSEFHRDVEQRKGRLPAWMVDMSRRLDFDWPV